MKPNELMIGDWVSYGNAYGKVWCLDEASDLVGLDLPDNMSTQDAHFEDTSPIPLTLEILEKNGFKSRKDGYDIGIPLLYWDKYCNAVCGWTHCDDIIEVFDCRYVHQLQHTLRLCEIDKEIEL